MYCFATYRAFFRAGTDEPGWSRTSSIASEAHARPSGDGTHLRSDRGHTRATPRLPPLGSRRPLECCSAGLGAVRASNPCLIPALAISSPSCPTASAQTATACAGGCARSSGRWTLAARSRGSLDAVAADVQRSRAARELRLADLPKPTFPQDLPVVERRDEIAKLIAENQVVVVCGETGSGKTTQLPKICLELGRGVDGMIGHTQPRRIAARSVARAHRAGAGQRRSARRSATRCGSTTARGPRRTSS